MNEYTLVVDGVIELIKYSKGLYANRNLVHHVGW